MPTYMLINCTYALTGAFSGWSATTRRVYNASGRPRLILHLAYNGVEKYKTGACHNTRNARKSALRWLKRWYVA